MDIKHALSRLVENNPSSEPGKIVDKYMKELDKTYPHGWKGLKREQMVNMVRNVRSKIRGADVWRAIEDYKIRMSPKEDSPVMIFNVTFSVDDKLHRIIGFSHRELLKKLRGKRHFFLDGTFKVVPDMFDQLCNLLVWDEDEEAYFNVAWILLTGRKEFLYNMLINLLASAAKVPRLDPLSFTCDFEQALINALILQFRSIANINGCLFHLKQANWGKLKALDLPENQIRFFAKKGGLLDMLAIVSKDEIESKGIPYVKAKIVAEFSHSMSEEHYTSWNNYFTYFVKEWLRKKNRLDSWHLLDQNGDIKPFRSRSNNCVEGYHSGLSEKLGIHPGVLEFIDRLKVEIDANVTRLNQYRNNNRSPPKYETSCLPHLPEDYHEFTPSDPICMSQPSLKRIGYNSVQDWTNNAKNVVIDEEGDERANGFYERAQLVYNNSPRGSLT